MGTSGRGGAVEVDPSPRSMSNLLSSRVEGSITLGRCSLVAPSTLQYHSSIGTMQLVAPSNFTVHYHTYTKKCRLMTHVFSWSKSQRPDHEVSLGGCERGTSESSLESDSGVVGVQE